MYLHVAGVRSETMYAVDSEEDEQREEDTWKDKGLLELTERLL